ncbi:MAG: hypothetical protein ACI9KS_000678 [Sulfitobacter sp.]|jgi:hypothetical protein
MDDLVAGQNLGDIAQSVMAPSDVLMGFKRAGDLPALLAQQGLGGGSGLGRDTLGARLAFAHKQAQGKWLVNYLPLSKRQQPLTQIHPALKFALADGSSEQPAPLGHHNEECERHTGQSRMGNCI